MHLSNGIAQQSIKNQAETSHSGHGNAFSLTVYCDRYSLVIQGNHKALLPPCTHQYATTPALAQLPSLLSPSHTSCDHSILPPSHVPSLASTHFKNPLYYGLADFPSTTSEKDFCHILIVQNLFVISSQKLQP